MSNELPKLIEFFYFSERSIIIKRVHQQNYRFRDISGKIFLRNSGNYISINCIPTNALFGAVLWLKELPAPISSKMRKANQKKSTGPCIEQCLKIFYAQRLKIIRRHGFQQERMELLCQRDDGSPARNFRCTNSLKKNLTFFQFFRPLCIYVYDRIHLSCNYHFNK